MLSLGSLRLEYVIARSSLRELVIMLLVVMVRMPSRDIGTCTVDSADCQGQSLGLITDAREPITDAGRPARRGRRVP